MDIVPYYMEMDCVRVHILYVYKLYTASENKIRIYNTVYTKTTHTDQENERKRAHGAMKKAREKEIEIEK